MKRSIKHTHIFILFLIIGMTSFSQDNNENWVKTTVYKKPFNNEASLPTAPPPEDATVQVSYFDGLGRPVQVINHAQSNTGKDIIQHIDYDKFGRQTKEYLPFTDFASNLNFRESPDVMGFYNGSNDYEATSNPYSEKQLENTSLSRVLKLAAPGNGWAIDSGHEIKLEYGTNKLNEVLLFTFNTAYNTATKTYDIPISLNAQNYYNENELYKIITRDENATATENSYTIDYKNKLGQVVLKRVRASISARTVDDTQNYDTYYVYDNLGNLSYVIPPLVDTTQSTITQTVLNGLCYQYKYDYRKRLVAKKIPGKRWEYIVYDKLDRVRATGPAKSPFNDLSGDGWLLTKYDAFDRPILTAWSPENDINENKRVDFENAVNNSSDLYEQKLATSNDTNTINSVSYGYSNDSYPTINYHILTVNYFNEYNYPTPPIIPTTVLGQNVRNGSTTTYNGLKTLVTGSWIRILEKSNLNITANLSYTFYKTDHLKSPIKTVTTYPNGGYTKTESEIDFEGKLLKTVTDHQKTNTSTAVTTIENFSYTPQGRLLSNTHKIDTDPVENIVTNEYKELGELKTKNVGQTATTPLQKVDYTYNIIGWLTGINDTNNLNDSIDDLFAFNISYNTPEDTNTTALYNGNVSETYWRTNADNMVRKYTYEYDGLNRLLEANYRNNDLSIDDTYNEHLTYDKNGNILSLKRNGGFEANTAYMIDNLVYNYDLNSLNQLKKVVDLSNSSQGFNDDANGTEASDTSDDYLYDFDGNMTKDENKNINLIIYNHLNLPSEIQFSQNRTIKYKYDANGIKLQKEVFDGTYTTITDYLDGYQYEDKHINNGGRGYSHLLFFPHAEGYVKPVYSENKTLTTRKFSYVYNYTDFWGNVRISYSKINGQIEVLEENNYYSFGLKHQNYNAVKNELSLKASNNEKQLVPTNVNGYKYKYQGQERQDELGLNWDSFKWRNYDYAIGRFMSLDPLAENYIYNSTYAFQENKMGMGVELEGLEIYNHKMGFKDNVKFNYYVAKSFIMSIHSSAEVIINPIKTVEAVVGLGNVVANPKQTGIAIKNNVVQTFTDMQSSDPEVAGTGTGKVYAFVAETVAGAELSNLAKISKIDNLVDYSKIGSTGSIGENFLKKLGGESQVYFKTTHGGRYVDQLIDGVAHESKVGYTSLTKSIQKQITKDTELLSTGQVNSVKWSFFESPVTGKVGASKPLLKALKSAGIETQIIKNID